MRIDNIAGNEKVKVSKGEGFTQKGSKFFPFFCKVFSVAEFNDVLEQIRKEHKHASHFCYAYIINEVTLPLIDGMTRKEKYNNDGEPSGVGMALLNLLKQKDLENCAVVVVRYFGGVLLGQGNLIRAYASAGKTLLV